MSKKKECYREHITYEPCGKCKEKWDKGAVIIEASESPNGKNNLLYKKVFIQQVYGGWLNESF